MNLSSARVERYAVGSPLLVPEHFFRGPLVAHGVILSRRGRALRHFVADIDAHWGDEGILNETFTFSDGVVEQRTWRLQPLTPGHYRGDADGVVGAAVIAVAGNAMHLDYRFCVSAAGRTIEVHMDDWMFLIDPHTVINRTRMSKFGVRLGEVVSVLRHNP